MQNASEAIFANKKTTKNPFLNALIFFTATLLITTLNDTKFFYPHYRFLFQIYIFLEISVNEDSRKKVKNDYIKKPLEIKRGFLVYVYVLLIYCVLESLAC